MKSKVNIRKIKLISILLKRKVVFENNITHIQNHTKKDKFTEVLTHLSTIRHGFQIMQG